MKFINKGCLSDSRLSSDKDHLPLSFQGLAEIASSWAIAASRSDHFLPALMPRSEGAPALTSLIEATNW